ncbi:hypothetical protein GLOIN_2v1770690 [Rhizophagus irregularis DAOM 181602=DAOM 197198]|uniref:Uncharacterized protein n=1 Tax=Rhizophagus irregularis (strain DAOM 181602 / DAOM 197198 / MUCL 43194) TaxID=747089 RepID=A0A2P4QBS6_RHIID|nr:hypothetical protein GLOIN_2v1770690 [Rhizophagus irregularis DAOM 181602=DAOM 197198]POG75082.1 hypothetical protein GLOIN_2v1770690 [Rhizophagus irregularis DAOM 181602=DAOM 197198]|eukprot:XP_025181948.1 hypothetical protein GLOIN_2v1770690 [Rhizophagus irregularis DAOM 181602=DAOM 197198]
METGRPNSHKRKQEQDRLKLARLSKNSMDYARACLILSNLLSIFSIIVAATIPLHMVSTSDAVPNELAKPCEPNVPLMLLLLMP